MADTTIALAAIALLALACQWLAWWVKLPAILLLLLTGIAIGPVAGWLQPDLLFGTLLFPMVSLAVALILFEGALTLHFDEIRGLQRVVRNLVTVGVVITWLVTTAAARFALEWSWPLSLLFGAIVVVTGPTVIVPMLRTVRPTAAVSSTLRWEGIVIDPIGALLAVLVFEAVVTGASAGLGHTVVHFGQTVAVGAGVGAAVGHAFGVVLRHHWLPEYLHNVAALTLVFGAFAGADAVMPESGLLAVTVMGMWLANMRGVRVDHILDFKESLSVLLISGLFIILAARMELARMLELGWSAALVLLALQFVARPLNVAVSTWGSALNWRERVILSWIGPRGIVAAAVAALFAIRLQQAGMAEAGLLVPLTFLVIIGTVVLQSATARPLAHWLGVAEPEPRGFLIIGANPVARAVAEALQRAEFHVLLADTHRENLRAARMAGLPTFYGNAVSEHADRKLDLVGIGRMLALTPQGDLNALAALRYRSEFGAAGVFVLGTATDEEAEEGADAGRGHRLFGPKVTYAKLASLLSQDAEVHATQLTESFDYNSYQARHRRRAVPLFAVDARGRVHLFLADDSPEPEPGWTVVALVPPDAEDEPAAADAAGP